MQYVNHKTIEDEVVNLLDPFDLCNVTKICGLKFWQHLSYLALSFAAMARLEEEEEV